MYWKKIDRGSKKWFENEMFRIRKNNDEMVKKMSEIRVEGNRREGIGQSRSGWRLLGKIRGPCEVDKDMIRNRET